MFKLISCNDSDVFHFSLLIWCCIFDTRNAYLKGVNRDQTNLTWPYRSKDLGENSVFGMWFFPQSILPAVIIYMTFSRIQSIDIHLSTFRTENLKIHPPPRHFSSIIDEAIWLMRTHFLNRNMLNNSQWKNLSAKYANYSNVDEVIWN